jgi:putative intracellular protease/amidase
LPEIAFLLYEDMTALDAIGPYEVLARLRGADVKFVASTPGQIKTDVGAVLVADSLLLGAAGVLEGKRAEIEVTR